MWFGTEVYHQLEFAPGAPPINIEITIESENLSGVYLISHINEASVSEVHGHVAVFLQQFLNEC